MSDDNEYITTKSEKQYGTTTYFSKANNFFHAIHCNSSCKSTTHHYICHCKIYMRIPICKQRCGSHTANNGKDQEKYVLLVAMYEGKSVNVQDCICYITPKKSRQILIQLFPPWVNCNMKNQTLKEHLSCKLIVFPKQGQQP